MVWSFTIQKTSPHAQPRHTCIVAEHWLVGFANVTVHRILKSKNKVIILFPFVFLIPSLSYFDSIRVCSFRLVSCTGLWYSLCHILGNYCSSLSNKWPPPKEGAHLEGHNIKQAPLLYKPHLPPSPIHFLNVGIQEKHVSTSTLWEFLRINNNIIWWL